MYYLYEYIYNMAYYVQHVCALIQDKLEIPNYVVPESYYNDRLIHYQELCIRQIRENRKDIHKANNLILTRNMNPGRVTDLNTIRGLNEPLWFFDKNKQETAATLEGYNQKTILNGKYNVNINVEFKVSEITLVDFTGKTPKEIEQKLMNITLMRAIFDYLYYKLEIWRKASDEQNDFNTYKRMFGYNDGTRISTFVNDRTIVEIILNDDEISKLVQGYFCSKVQLRRGQVTKYFHEEYCVLQRYCLGMSKQPNNLMENAFISNKVVQDSEGHFRMKGGNPQQKLLENLIFDPNGIDKDPIDEFFLKCNSLIYYGIDDPDEIDEVMLYIIDPYIREIVRTDIKIKIIENRKAMIPLHTFTKIDIPNIFGRSISAYGGKTKRYRKGVKKHRKGRRTSKV